MDDENITNELDETTARDRDETRRLLYVALAASRTKRYNLAGTLVNALKHHQGVDDDPIDLMDKVVAAVDGQPGSSAWLLEQIQRLTAELEG